MLIRIVREQHTVKKKKKEVETAVYLTEAWLCEHYTTPILIVLVTQTPIRPFTCCFVLWLEKLTDF